MQKILLVSNSAWNIYHFRRPIVDALSKTGHEVSVAAPHDEFVGKLRALGVNFQYLPLKPGGTNPFADAAYFLRLLYLLLKTRPTALLTFTVKPNIYGALAARLTKIPVFSTISGLGSAFLAGGKVEWITKLLLRLSLRQSRVVFIQNSDDSELLTKKGIVQESQVRLVPGSGIDTDFFALAPLPSRAPFTFLQIGRLLNDKGVAELVNAARTLRDDGHDFQLVLLGDAEANNPSAISHGTLSAWLRDGLVTHVAPVEDVRPWIETSDAVVLASYREGLPRSLLEGAAMGRPLIATDVPGCRDVVENGKNGILCAPRSVSALYTAMKDMINMPVDERERMGKASRERVQARFEKSIVASAYLRELRFL